jgi:hypothetical protein
VVAESTAFDSRHPHLPDPPLGVDDRGPEVSVRQTGPSNHHPNPSSHREKNREEEGSFEDLGEFSCAPTARGTMIFEATYSLSRIGNPASRATPTARPLPSLLNDHT